MRLRSVLARSPRFRVGDDARAAPAAARVPHCGRRPFGRWLAGVAAVAVLSGCAATGRLAYAPDELRAELHARVAESERDELVVPFEVDARTLARARELVGRWRTDHERAIALVDALADPDGFALRYRWALHNSAERTLAHGGGNCLGLSSLLVGLARGLGLAAYYADDFATRPERRQEHEVNVAAGHIGAVLYTEQGRIFVDFSGEIEETWRLRRIDDIQAVAHYYNNLGYELIHSADRDGVPVDWLAVRRQFELAVQIAPDFASAWNNLGVARARLGDREGAEQSYRRALALDPSMRSSLTNLELLEQRGARRPRS